MWTGDKVFHASGGSVFRQEGGFFPAQMRMAQASRPGAAGGVA